VILAVGVVLTLVAVEVAHLVNADDSELKAFRQRFGEEKIVGKTAQQVVTTFGRPSSSFTSPNGEEVSMRYEQGIYSCDIEFVDGVAVYVTRSPDP
jgi:hypothetical protein